MMQKKIEEKSIWYNQTTKKYVQVKEITHWCGNEAEDYAYIVLSGDCTILQDATTNIVRQVLQKKQFLQNYDLVTIDKTTAQKYNLHSSVSNKTITFKSNLIKKLIPYAESVGIDFDSFDFNDEAYTFVDMKDVVEYTRDVEEIKKAINACFKITARNPFWCEGRNYAIATILQELGMNNDN